MAIDISVYGHLTIDTIFDNSKEYSFGGIANVWSALKNINSDLIIDISPTQYGEALIYVDRDNSKRYSDALLNMKTFFPDIQKSKISLVLYLNELLETKFLDNLKSYNIADTCKGKKLNLNLLNNIDLLVSSDEDIPDIKNYTDYFDGIVLIHSAFGSKLGLRDNYFEFELDKKDQHSNINVLGAGDIFLSFLANLILSNKTHALKNKKDQYDSILKFLPKVHKSTSDYLLKINKID